MRSWIKDPIAILTEGAGCGVVGDDGHIVELARHADKDSLRLRGRHS
jgi:hypothetical protein